MPGWFIHAPRMGLTSRANNKLMLNVEKKAVKNQIIEPFSSINGIVFAVKDTFSESFSCTLRHKDTGTELMLSPHKKAIRIEPAL